MASNWEVTQLWVNDGSSKALARGLVRTGAANIRFTIMRGSNGPFVSLPRSQDKKDPSKWYDEVQCISKEAKIELQNLVLEEFKKRAAAGPSKPAQAKLPEF